MTLDQQIQSICTKAIPLPQCPVKRVHAIAQRVWLEVKNKRTAKRAIAKGRV